MIEYKINDAGERLENDLVEMRKDIMKN